ncbi:hypothetical protein J2T57_001574 [Natronocella acetinitrilica]|uniref:Uncharacterized protein n=1 Tax=Natronocella acetinitrilica TaxID=414046 RepID=A0AAE3G5X8_9GAMM|nr:hypothetical protein [Natronocella acetinitrilica]MCP1674472.1 hypothetical protein [Natronocella acetinitrilica]
MQQLTHDAFSIAIPDGALTALTGEDCRFRPAGRPGMAHTRILGSLTLSARGTPERLLCLEGIAVAPGEDGRIALDPTLQPRLDAALALLGSAPHALFTWQGQRYALFAPPLAPLGDFLADAEDPATDPFI